MHGNGGPFEEHRQLLFGIAYRMLGTRSDAEDVLQDAWLRWNRAPATDVDDPRAYLARLVTNQAIDQLRKVRARRETYVGPWLPEPLVGPGSADGADRAELAESVSMGLLVVLETLTSAQRAVFVLHEAFGFSHAEIGAMLGRTERAVRQLAYRARREVDARRARPGAPTTPDRAREITDRFLAAAVGGDIAALLELLAPDVTIWFDADGRRETPREALHGGRTVAGYLASVTPFWPPRATHRAVAVGGEPGGLVVADGRPFAVLGLELDGERITAVRVVLNPDKLRHAGDAG